MKKFQLIIIAFFFLTELSFGQKMMASEQYPELKYEYLKGVVFYSDYRQIKGNAYLTTDWCIGSIRLKDDHEIRNIKLKFDVYQHRLIVYQEYLKRLVIPEKQDIASFTLEIDGTTRNFKYVEAELASKSSLTQYFLEVLMEGKVSFYRLYFRDVLPLKTAEMPYIDEFIEQSDYYLFYQGEYQVARLTKSYLIKRFPQYKNEIRRFARENNLKIKNDKDYALLVGYISELVSSKN
jgi:hypothetical protein